MMLKTDGRGDEKAYTGATYLYIRSIDNDFGNRPLAPNTLFWLSPDITLVDANGPVLSTTVDANTPYFVRVTVRNDGDHDCHSSIVELFLTDPTIGFSLAASKQIGIKTVSIPGHSSVDVEFSFLVPNQESGHKCLFARTHSFSNNDYPKDFDYFKPMGELPYCPEKSFHRQPREEVSSSI